MQSLRPEQFSNQQYQDFLKGIQDEFKQFFEVILQKYVIAPLSYGEEFTHQAGLRVKFEEEYNRKLRINEHNKEFKIEPKEVYVSENVEKEWKEFKQQINNQPGVRQGRHPFFSTEYQNACSYFGEREFILMTIAMRLNTPIVPLTNAGFLPVYMFLSYILNKNGVEDHVYDVSQGLQDIKTVINERILKQLLFDLTKVSTQENYVKSIEKYLQLIFYILINSIVSMNPANWAILDYFATIIQSTQLTQEWQRIRLNPTEWQKNLVQTAMQIAAQKKLAQLKPHPAPSVRFENKIDSKTNIPSTPLSLPQDPFESAGPSTHFFEEPVFPPEVPTQSGPFYTPLAINIPQSPTVTLPPSPGFALEARTPFVGAPFLLFSQPQTTEPAPVKNKKRKSAGEQKKVSREEKALLSMPDVPAEVTCIMTKFLWKIKENIRETCTKLNLGKHYNFDSTERMENIYKLLSVLFTEQENNLISLLEDETYIDFEKLIRILRAFSSEDIIKKFNTAGNKILYPNLLVVALLSTKVASEPSNKEIFDSFLKIKKKKSINSLVQAFEKALNDSDDDDADETDRADKRPRKGRGPRK